MKKIFEPVEMNNLTLRNRLIRSATWEGIANSDGSLMDEAYDIYCELAKGGVGVIITGFTSVVPHDHNSDGTMRLCDDALIAQYRKLVDIIHAEGCPVITEIALGDYHREKNGRYMKVEPDDMSVDEIRMVISQFVDAASRADEAGFDGIQIHAAHFFFLSRFISPAANHRTDKYGGSTENRCRILVEIMDGIRKVAPALHITIKINSSDFTFGGVDEDECIAICRILDRAGIDSIEVSGNGTSVAAIKVHVNEGYFVSTAIKIADSVSCPVSVVGGLRSTDTIEYILNKTNISMISLSRPLLCEPDLPNKMKKDSAVISKCISCNRCYSSHLHKCILREVDLAG
ncbi:NADH:flavin oxidoreductase [Methanobrevibacter sp.]|uniref:NADH:flavin oxidoreductase n=1 Tax=Methanobrevibacter sp. TaxID=66852 RepID=UPI0026DF40F2|nr:NADH:flavin oxidoreductase [Methanobrevibacter sp.]MDO5859122.1 NADH:flavin oxidoreductase [Methanobrevibacter sp.]